MEKCPVCGMNIDRKDAPVEIAYQGKTYYFCSEECAQQFNENPQRYVTQKVR